MAPGKVGIRHQMLTTLMMDKLWAEGEGLHAARMVKTISTHLLVIHHLLSSNKYLSGTPTVCQAPGIEVIDVSYPASKILRIQWPSEGMNSLECTSSAMEIGQILF